MGVQNGNSNNQLIQFPRLQTNHYAVPGCTFPSPDHVYKLFLSPISSHIAPSSSHTTMSRPRQRSPPPDQNHEGDNDRRPHQYQYHYECRCERACQCWRDQPDQEDPQSDQSDQSDQYDSQSSDESEDSENAEQLSEDDERPTDHYLYQYDQRQYHYHYNDLRQYQQHHYHSRPQTPNSRPQSTPPSDFEDNEIDYNEQN